MEKGQEASNDKNLIIDAGDLTNNCKFRVMVNGVRSASNDANALGIDVRTLSIGVRIVSNDVRTGSNDANALNIINNGESIIDNSVTIIDNGGSIGVGNKTTNNVFILQTPRKFLPISVRTVV